MSTDDKIVGIRADVDNLLNAVPRDEVIAAIEELLQEAKSGKVQEIACVVVDNNRDMKCVISNTREGHGIILAGAVAIMQQELLSRMVEK